MSMAGNWPARRKDSLITRLARLRSTARGQHPFTNYESETRHFNRVVQSRKPQWSPAGTNRRIVQHLVELVLAKQPAGATEPMVTASLFLCAADRASPREISHRELGATAPRSRLHSDRRI